LVPDDVLNKGIADGRITPNITRKQVEALHRNPPRPRRKCLKRVPNGILTSWEDVNKFRDVVTHNAQVQARQYELGLRAQRGPKIFTTSSELTRTTSELRNMMSGSSGIAKDY
jgi:hypothetical protein